ncbi:DUF3761 domain-containing protein [Sphingomonas sp. ASV193]|uniref:DUF3761 domain-containing protein n=1 Tax=Sphingomonas sp. ASV193 TaxID=3144405 RepID=UPI0032E8F779
MRIVLFVTAIAASSVFVAPASAAERHYDCSKAGNANKAACKAAASASAKPIETKTTSVTTKTTTRHYDCTKAGNKNKAECRAASTQTASGSAAGAVKTTTTATATTTDCTKWYNKVRATCRSATTAAAPTTTVRPTPRPVTVPAASSENTNPAGAIARCKDGLYSHAAHRSGACSRHGGVASWS